MIPIYTLFFNYENIFFLIRTMKNERNKTQFTKNISSAQNFFQVFYLYIIYLISLDSAQQTNEEIFSKT